MIGEVVIGGLIFAHKGYRPHVERGWIKVCDHKGVGWSNQPRNNVATNDCGFSGITDMEKKNGN